MTDIRAEMDRLAAAWKGPDGVGSLPSVTAEAREALTGAIWLTRARIVLDLGCGSCAWQREAIPPGVTYTGVDVREFPGWPDCCRHLDIVAGPIPRADLLVCRDVLIHLTEAELGRVLDHIRRSGSTWMLVTSHREERRRKYRHSWYVMSNWLPGKRVAAWPDCGRHFELWRLQNEN